jgi:ferredoxin
MSFTFKVDEDMCMGAQRCLYLAPNTFELTEHGFATVTDSSALTPQEADKVAWECPNGAIAVEHHGAGGRPA